MDFSVPIDVARYKRDILKTMNSKVVEKHAKHLYFVILRIQRMHSKLCAHNHLETLTVSLNL